MTSFVTDGGMLVPAVTAETMREVDRIAIEEHTPNLFQMMENAGRSLALAAIDHIGPGWRQVRIAVCAGSGGNGGGGICAARHLANHGGDVVLVLSEPARLSPVTDQQLHVYQKTSGRIDRAGSFEPGLILDAVREHGGRRPRTDVFTECDHLRDWLDGDVAALAGASSGPSSATFGRLSHFVRATRSATPTSTTRAARARPPVFGRPPLLRMVPA